jgi:hypothetical protein
MRSASFRARHGINRLTLGAALWVTVAFSPALHAQTGDTVLKRVLAPGVTYRHIVDQRGRLAMHVVTVDLRRPDIELRVARAHDQLKGREKTSEMVRRVVAGGVQVPAAVNADFFELASGENENEQILRGEWWKGLKVTDSPYDTYDNVHVQFGLDAAGRPVMDRYILDGKAWDRGAMTPIVAMNFNPSGKPEGTALFTARYGATAPRDTTRPTAEAAMTAAGHRGDTLLFVRRGAVSTTSGSTIPSDGAVLAAYGARTKEVQAMAEGDTVKVLLATLPRPPHGAVPVLLIGGWPRILRDGENVAGDAATIEGTLSRNAEMAHPRTAVGFSRDSGTVILLTVDGRSENSGGVTLVDLARLMRRLGAWQAMNFDGGGSTTMVIDGAVVNAPSDKTGEREVGNALLVVRKRT